MKIARIKLIELVRSHLQKLQNDRTARYEKDLIMYRDECRTYVEQTEHDWREFINVIESRLAAKEPLRASDLPLGLRSHGNINWVRASTPKRRDPGPDEANLELLLTLLESSVDDLISTYSLEKMGFSMGRVLG